MLHEYFESIARACLTHGDVGVSVEIVLAGIYFKGVLVKLASEFWTTKLEKLIL